MTVTELLKPFCGVTETVTVELVFPIVQEAEEGETEILKSGGGGGGGWFPPLHPASPPKRAATATDARIAFEMDPVRIAVSLPAPTGEDTYTPHKGPSASRTATQSGDCTSARFSFAFLRANERNRDLSSSANCKEKHGTCSDDKADARRDQWRAEPVMLCKSPVQFVNSEVFHSPPPARITNGL